MPNVTEADLLAAIAANLMTAPETISDFFTPTGFPSFESTAVAFPNGRSEKFVGLNGATQYYTFDWSQANSGDKGIVSLWIKPNFTHLTDGTFFFLESLNAFTGSGRVGHQMYFYGLWDDWVTRCYANGANAYNTPTAGETWSAGDVIHMVYMYNNEAGLDGGKSMAFYINNVLKTTSTNTWAGGNDSNPEARLGGESAHGTRHFPGGLFDVGFLEYETLAASYTDAEIVQALYSNDYDDGAHKFNYELGGAPPAGPGLTIAGRKVRIRTNGATVVDMTDTAKIGDVAGGNYSEIEADGTYVANGDATTYRDEYVAGPYVQASASAAPDQENYTIGGVATRKYSFNGVNTEERLSNSFEDPHDRKLLSPIEVHIHFRPSTNDAGNVKWFFDWEHSKANTAHTVTPVAPAAQGTLSVVIPITADTQYYHYVYTIGILPEIGITLGDIISFNIRRSPSDDQDTYNADAIFEKVALHIECDTLGSRQRYIK